MLNNFILPTHSSDSLFIEKKSKIIDDFNKESHNLNNKIITQKAKREYIIKFINNMNNLLENSQLSGDAYKLREIKENANKILEQVDENIDLLNSLEFKLNELNKNIVNFFNCSDSNSNDEYQTQNIQEIDDSINSYYNNSKKTNEKLILNDLRIDYFVENSISKNFIIDFSLSSDVENINSTPENFDLKDNSTLVISEIKNEVLLPYKVSEINEYINQYPNSYKSFNDVIKKEFILPLNYYMKHPSVARFRETYSLIRDRESKSIVEALKYAIDLMFKAELNPTIIAACKTQDQLEHYLDCLESNKLDNFKDFEIKFEINPI